MMDKGKNKIPKGSLIFTVQKHDASHLHYDFRLEFRGSLLSWAIPKGPSQNPEIKHLAMRVEDHAYSYRDFEGVIPAGYGAGTVMLWDEGYYTVPGAETKQEAEKAIALGLDKGKLEFELHGHKLKGVFALIRTQMQENSWLIIKHKDQYASTEEITTKDRSVKTKRTMEEIAEQDG